MFFTLLAVIFVGSLAWCASGEAGFVPAPGADPGNGIVTVEQAKQLPDDTHVVLRGNIQSRTREDHYVFRDETGTITIEIDDDDWHGLVVGPDDRVEIVGEVDRDFNSIKVDVDVIRKLESA